MIDLRPLSDYQRALQFPPSTFVGWIIQGAVYGGGLAFVWSIVWLVVVFGLAVGWSR